MLTVNEIKTRKGVNQIGTLKRASDTRCDSHFGSMCSLTTLFDSTCLMLENIKKKDPLILKEEMPMLHPS